MGLLIERTFQLVGLAFQVAELMGLFEKKKKYQQDLEKNWFPPIDPQTSVHHLEETSESK